MPSWNKVLISGSNAQLNSLFVTTNVTASQFSGSFIGDGSQLTGITTTSASYAATASYIPGQTIKAGSISGSSFIGTPRKFTVTFTTPFTNNDYSITLAGDFSRTYIVESKVSGSFVINTQSNTVLGAGFVYWHAIRNGEFNS